jgi:hypothetical protein
LGDVLESAHGDLGSSHQLLDERLLDGHEFLEELFLLGVPLDQLVDSLLGLLDLG